MLKTREETHRSAVEGNSILSSEIRFFLLPFAPKELILGGTKSPDVIIRAERIALSMIKKLNPDITHGDKIFTFECVFGARFLITVFYRVRLRARAHKDVQDSCRVSEWPGAPVAGRGRWSRGSVRGPVAARRRRQHRRRRE